MWDFDTDPEYQEKLDWVEEFMVNELEPLDLVALDPYDKKNAETMAILRPLQQQVRDHGLWAPHHASSASGSALGPNRLHKVVSWICIQRGGRHIGHNVGPPLDNTISPVTSKPNRW